MSDINQAGGLVLTDGRRLRKDLREAPPNLVVKIAELEAKNKELEEYIEIDCRQVIQNFHEANIKLTARCEKMREAGQDLVEGISKTHPNYTYAQVWINADKVFYGV